jgi:Spy/CpxP family protein refolding chaperone
MKKNLFLTIALGMFLTGGIIAQNPNPQDFQQRRQQQIDNLKKELVLTKEQNTKFDAIYKEYNDKVQAARDAAGDNREGMREKMQGLSKDRDAKIEKILTPEQVKKWKDYQAKLQAERQNLQRGPGGQGGGRGGN